MSPAVRDPSRVAESMTLLAKESPRRAKNLAKALQGVGGKGMDFTQFTQGGGTKSIIANLTNKNKGILRQLSRQYSNHADPTVRRLAGDLGNRVGPSALQRTGQAVTSPQGMANMGRWLLPAGAAGSYPRIARYFRSGQKV